MMITWCPQCGAGVDVDEDGCCVTCGNGATGEAADLAAGLLADFFKLRADFFKLRNALEGLVGASTREELETLEAGVRLTPGVERDKIAALNAIHALQDTLPVKP